MRPSWLCVVSLLGACALSDPPAEQTSGSETGALPSPPRIVDLGADRLQITEGDSVTFTAYVEDDDGLLDVTGTLELPGGAAGDFAPAQSGRFVLTLSWAQIHALDPIDFEDAQIRTFTARFTDLIGEDTAILDVTLTCIGIEPAACDGVCVDLDVGPCP